MARPPWGLPREGRRRTKCYVLIRVRVNPLLNRSSTASPPPPRERGLPAHPDTDLEPARGVRAC